VEDPDGSAKTPSGGWAFRHGPEAVAGDKFKLGTRLDSAALLLGRRTWQLFARIWPGRTDEFSTRLNKAPKWVATRTLTDVSAWGNSALIVGGVTEGVQRLQRESEVILFGSTSLAQTLRKHDLVDEYHLLVFPTVLGTGRRLFGSPDDSGDLQLVNVEQSGAAVLMRYDNVR
jgi:dihydrofolate reductase